MFERFNDRARRVVVLAQEEARMLGHNHIGSEHLLLGLIHEQSGIAAQVLAAAGVTLADARVQVAELASPGDKLPRGHIPFTHRAKTILELSLREALEQGRSYIGTEHILLGLIRDAGGAGAQILERLGGPLPALREQVLAAATAAPPEETRAAEAEMEAAATSSWPPGAAARRFVLPQALTGAEFRELLTSIDRRLGGIERRFGIPTPDRGASLWSIDRRLAVIGRHLGLPKQPPDEPGQPDAAGQPDEPGRPGRSDQAADGDDRPAAGE